MSHQRERPAEGAGLIVRRGDGAVLTGIRTGQARSWPGTMAFPGGAADDDDATLPLAVGDPDPAARAARAAALRESLEEAGLVLVCRDDGGAAGAASVDALVHAVRDGAPLREALAAQRLVLDDRGLVPLPPWLTVEGSFLVRRFLLPIDVEPVRVAPLVEELDDLAFRSPRAILRAWHTGHAWLLPPIRDMLHRLADGEDDDTDAILPRLRAPPSEPDRVRRDVAPGVVLLDARTPTLWPATHTNTPVLGTGDVLLVDPATPYEDERARMDALLDVILAGRGVAGIVLTHHHPDHTGDAARLRHKHRCPVYAHALTRERTDVPVDIVIDDGHVFDLPGPVPRRFVALHTPGHARGHLCLWDTSISLLIAGDMVAGTGSILIDPPEGHMATYLRSLERLLALAPRALIPAHGPLLIDGTACLQRQHAHRRQREAAVLAAIADGAATLDAVVDVVYGRDTPPAMLAFAARSVAAIVEKLVEDGAVVEGTGGFASCP